MRLLEYTTIIFEIIDFHPIKPMVKRIEDQAKLLEVPSQYEQSFNTIFIRTSYSCHTKAY